MLGEGDSMLVESARKSVKKSLDNLKRRGSSRRQVGMFLQQLVGLLLNLDELRLKNDCEECLTKVAEVEAKGSQLNRSVEACTSEFVPPDLKRSIEELRTYSTEVIRLLGQLALRLDQYFGYPLQRMVQEAATLVTILEEIQDVVSSLSNLVRNNNNQADLSPQLSKWNEGFNKLNTFRTNFYMRSSGHRMNKDLLDKFKILLQRIRRQHCPVWYDDFAEAVGARDFVELRTYQKRIEEYLDELAEILLDIAGMQDYDGE